MWLRFVAFPLAVLAGLLAAGVLAVGLVVVLGLGITVINATVSRSQ